MTPTENYENNDNYYKSDAPCRKIPTFLLLRRSRGMRHTGKVGIALTGCVAHRSKQDICVPQMSEPTVRVVGNLKGTPPNPRKKKCI